MGGIQSALSGGPVCFLIFCSISMFLLASLLAGRRPLFQLVHGSRECTPSEPSTGISNLLQPAQAEVVLGQFSSFLASWGGDNMYRRGQCSGIIAVVGIIVTGTQEPGIFYRKTGLDLKIYQRMLKSLNTHILTCTVQGILRKSLRERQCRLRKVVE